MQSISVFMQDVKLLVLRRKHPIARSLFARIMRNAGCVHHGEAHATTVRTMGSAIFTLMAYRTGLAQTPRESEVQNKAGDRSN